MADSSAVDPTDASSTDVSGALAYLDSVRGRYRDRAAVYHEFLDIMKDFKQGRCVIRHVPVQLQHFIDASFVRMDRLDVVRRISRLFLESPYHIEGFSAFLPSTLELQISRADPNHPVVNLNTHNPGVAVQTLTIALSDEETARLATALRGQSSIAAHQTAQQQGPEFVNAITFLDKVRARYGREDNSLYRTFLGLMQKQQKGEVTLVGHISSSEAFGTD